MSIIGPVAEGVLAAFCACGVLLLAWIAYCETLRILRRRKPARPPGRCLCGQRHIPMPGLPVDGRHLDDYESRKLASVISGYYSAPAGSDEREASQ